jgi:hypothetical protein
VYQPSSCSSTLPSSTERLCQKLASASPNAGKVRHLPIDDIHASGNSRLIPGLNEEAVCV